jgi:hypothetical protein
MEFFIKRPKKSKNIIKFGLNYSKFLNEILFYRRTRSLNFSNFSIPKYHSSNLFQLKIYKVNNISTLSPSDDEIISSIVEFSKMLKPRIFDRLSYNLRSPFLSVIRLFIHAKLLGYLDVKLIKFIDFVIDSKCVETRSDFFLIHKDFRKIENVLYSEDGIVILLDFESVTYTRRWYLTDIVDYYFDPINYKFNMEPVLQYVKTIEFDFSNQSLDYQVKVSILRKSLSYLIYNYGNGISRDVMSKFVSSIISN